MDIQQVIKERYAQLPPDLQRAIKSADLAEKFARIADKHSLHIDQNGSLQTETILVMLGLEPASDYVGNLEKELNISGREAQAIAEDVNTEILNAIKSSLRTLEEKEEQEEEEIEYKKTDDISRILEKIPIPTPPAPVQNLNMLSVEKAGDFTVEKRQASTSPLYNSSNLTKENVLNDLENIEKLKPQNAANFVDHLLSNAISKPQEVEIKKPQEKPEAKSEPEIKPKYTADPYREQV